MDKIQGSPTDAPDTKSGTGRVGTITTVLDALTPVCAPLAARWDAEAARRLELRTPENLKALMDAQTGHTKARSTANAASRQRKAARQASKNPLGGARRAARSADRAARTHHRAARAALRQARLNYPNTLAGTWVRRHAGHVLPAALGSWALSEAHGLTVWPSALSLALVVAHAVALWLGRRAVSAPVAPQTDGASAEEQRLLDRLAPEWWVTHAAERGLEGTVTGRPELTAAGIVCTVRLDGKKWSAKELAGAADQVRALLGMRTETRMEITRGTHGDRALIRIRTRSASDGLDLAGWKPGDVWAVDTVTGETVPVPLGKRILIAGTSGSGKSTSARPLLAEASERPDHRLVILDRKYVEGRTWEHRARVACELADMRAVVGELIEEGEERLKVLPRGEDAVQISPARPRITVFVDEMGELLSDCAAKYRDEDGKSADYLDVIAGLRTIARKYRAAEIILVPATQKPTLTGDGHGLDSQIAGQLTVRLALAVATSTETQSVFGPDAIEKGWKAHELPMPWVALMRDQDKGPKQRTNPIRMRWMTAQQVIDLPARPIWTREPAPVPAPDPGTGGRRLALVKSDPAPVAAPEAAAAPAPAVPAQPAAPAEGSAPAQVLDAIRTLRPPVRQADIVKSTGLPRGTVSKAVKKLVDGGLLVRESDGTVRESGSEVSA